MASRNNPRRGACCITPATCSACQDSLPRYLCFRATLSASGTGSGTVLPCCSVVTGRLLPVSGTDCGWQSTNLRCSDGSGEVGVVTVTIEREPTGTGTGTGTGCVTHVHVLQEDLYFDGVIPSGMTFTITKLGIKYECEVFHASMVANPMAFGKCPLCSCATCIPEFLCIRVVHGDKTGNGVASWDCETMYWLASDITLTGGTGTGTGSPETVSVSLRLANKSDDVGCAIIGTASGLGESSSFVIDIEPTTETPGMKGFYCVEGVGALTRGRPPFDTHDITTIIDHSVTVGPTTGTGAANSFQLFISDRACGQSCALDCSTTFVGPTPCCPGLLIPTVMQCSFTGCTTGPMVLTYDTGWMWRGVGPDGFIYSLMCLGASWFLGSDFGCNFTSGTVDCNPFELSFDFDNIRCPPPHCDGFTVVITF